MPTYRLGKFKITPKGEYNANETYDELDLIKYKGGSYLVLKTVTGVTPTDDNINYQAISEPSESLSVNEEKPIKSKAVFNALNKKYEVIETVTTTEEISLFVRSAEPNGTAYKFDRLKVLIELPAASAKSPITVKMQKDSAGSWVFYYNNAIGIDTVKSYLYCEAYKEYGYWQSTTARTIGEYGFGNKTNQVPAFWLFSEKSTPNIGNLRIEGNLPIGTKITILGVRA